MGQTPISGLKHFKEGYSRFCSLRRLAALKVSLRKGLGFRAEGVEVWYELDTVSLGAVSTRSRYAWGFARVPAGV